MISIATNKSSYWPGDEIAASVELVLKKPVKGRGLIAVLECHESHKVEVTKQLDQYDYDREKELGIPRSTHLKTETHFHDEIIFKKEMKLAGERVYGKENFEVKFQLPKDAKPTSKEYGHDKFIHVWKLKVKLDIPLTIDKNAEKEIFVDGL
ncbi:MAG: hypothetical protein V1492_03285 [Candidatus Micrarchaeota archaeon]